MATNYVQDGDVLQITNSSGATIASGVGILAGAKVGIALVTLANGATGSVAMEGVWTHAKNTGASTGGAQGANAYWDNTAKKFTAVSTSNTLAGYFAETCADNDATCKVKLLG
jgi:predicted RecA/RadA family phage recombinase